MGWVLAGLLAVNTVLTALCLLAIGYIGVQMSSVTDAVDAVKQAVTDGFAAVDSAVQAAADRVIAHLQTDTADVASAIDELNALKGSVSETATAEVAKINAIAAPPAE